MRLDPVSLLPGQQAPGIVEKPLVRGTPGIRKNMLKIIVHFAAPL